VKVLTVKNPWAFLIIRYGKDMENRARKTNYRGRVAIHASLKSDEDAYQSHFINSPKMNKIFDAIRERRAEIEKLNGAL
jgi:hypothetical protein